jgi:L-2-hydroxyglutarate oxidase LhgO
MPQEFDYIVIGGGVIGLSVAYALQKKYPKARVLLIEKEGDVAAHASGRNSGILHAGFYYSADSFKAKFTVAGNIAMKEFCRRHNIPINDSGKLVVAKNDQELAALDELLKRGKANGSNVSLISAAEAEKIEPNVKTHKKALFSPDTACLNPEQVCDVLKQVLMERGVRFSFNTCYLSHQGNVIQTTQGDFTAKTLINAAGLYADKIAQDFGFGGRYTMIPFKGLYLKYTKNKTDIKISIYPVPDLRNPFLGVHFTKTVDGGIKIGPTAIPAFWRENYSLRENFKAGELAEILKYETLLFFKNSFHFRDLAFEEIRKYYRKYFISLACAMVKHIDPAGFTCHTAPGIRAQLLDKQSLSLVQDFVVEGDGSTVHVLNAVSPAFTCAFPFADYILAHYLPS